MKSFIPNASKKETIKTTIFQPNRRQFIKGSLGLVVALYLPFGNKGNAQQNADKQIMPNAFVRIASDNTVTVLIKHLEMGQGAFTGLATLVAEELEADWSQMRAEHAPVITALYKNFAFGIQGVGGSTGLANSYEQMRKAGAGMKAMLVAAAAQKWDASESDIEVKKGIVSHKGTANTATFGELAQAASALDPPSDVTLKPTSEFTLIGTNLPKLDTQAKASGEAVFTQDIYVDNMRYAAIAHSPLFGGSVKSFNADKTKAIKGVIEVVQVPSGVAVIAGSTYVAMRGRDELDIQWDNAKAETRSTQQIMAEYLKQAQEPGIVAHEHGDITTAIESAEQSFTVEYEFPYLAHTPMETLDGVIRANKDSTVDAWMGSQLQTVDQGTIAGVLGVKPEQVNLMTQLGGGSFGRRAQPDSGFAAELAQIVKTQPKGTAVKLIWSRENDVKGGRYRPLTVHKIVGSLDKDGNISAWQQTIATQSIMAGSPFAAAIKNGIDPTSIEGASDLPYNFASRQTSLHTMTNPVPILWWRSVGHTHTGYTVETMLDFLLQKANKDPLAGRLALLPEKARERAVLQAVANMAEKSGPTAKGSARGLAVHKSFGTYVAQIAEVTKNKEGLPKVTNVWCAVDCGIAVNPNIVRAQIEGGIGFGLSAILQEELTLSNTGHVEQSNFDTYKPLRIYDMPAVEVEIVITDNPPTGVGEPGVPPLGPAVANAWRRLTGQMVTRLPFSKNINNTMAEV